MFSRKIDVLIVEDDPLYANLLKRALSTSSVGTFTTSSATSLAEALEKIGQTAFNAVILDLNLPDSRSLDSIYRIRDQSPATPIIVLSGSDDRTLALAAVKAGAQDYLIKGQPSDDSICRAVRYAIERRAHLELAYEHEKKMALLEQLQEFMAALTHDLRGPLNATSRILEMMARERIGTVSEEQERVLIMLKENNDQLVSMIQRLTDVYQFESDARNMEMEQVDLVQLISSCVDEMRPIAEQNCINLDFQLGEASEALVDVSSIKRLMHNLLDNALKFTDKNGHVTVRMKSNTNQLILEVSDDGKGIAPEVRDYLFQRFKHGHHGQHFPPGSGLGLHLCKKITELYSGQIECESEIGKGSTFRITLPITTKRLSAVASDEG